MSGGRSSSDRKLSSDGIADLLAAFEPQAGSTGATLSWFANLVLASTSSVQVSVFDTRRGTANTLRIGTVVSAPDATPPTSLIAALAGDASRHKGRSGCFALGRHAWGQGTASVFGLRLSDGEEGVASGLAFFRMEPTLDEQHVLEGLCGLGGALLSAARKAHVARATDTAANAFEERMAHALRLGADIFWGADRDTCVRDVVHLGQDMSLSVLEGKRLDSFLELPRSGTFRGARVSLRSMTNAELALELSGSRAEDGTWHGIARRLVGADIGALTDGHARSLIGKLETARDREADLRRETEILLDGLRILTSGKPSRQVFDELMSLLAPALEFEAALILQQEWSGAFTVSVATDTRTATLDWSRIALDLFAQADIAATLRIPEELALHGLDDETPPRSALVIKLSGGSKPTLLLCLHRKPHFFGTRHQGLGARLSLMASQAYVNDEERQKVVDASQLATIGEMAAGIIHEINQPLTAMTLAISNLKDAVDSGADIGRDKLGTKLTRVQTQLDRLSKIVSNMRVLTRRSTGTHAPFRVKASVLEAVGIIQHKLGKASIEIDVDIADDIEALGNPLEFSQVILNLVSNAHDALESNTGKTARDGSTRRAILITATTIGKDVIELTVRDTGPGFPDEKAEKAFEPFFTTKEPGKGTGLGLALCRRIVENMDGTIKLGNWSGGAELRLRMKRA